MPKNSRPELQMKKGKPAGRSAGRAPGKPAKKGGSTGGWRGWLRAALRSSVIGTLLAAGLVGWVQWRWAERQVDEGLSRPVWTVPGRVTSGPLEVWPGLRESPEELASDLSAAGYARVARASQPGDFAVSGDAVHIVRAAAKGPGYAISTGESMVTFAGDRVESVTPDGKLTLPPATLALVRGPDNENRSPVPLDRIPKHMREAVLAMEDARFYDHAGIDPIGILRAMARNAMAGEWEQGGSTLTQQLVKNVFLTQERTAERKWREALISLAIERRLSKDEILALYLNEIYFGQSGGSSVCGVDAAARAYFGKPVDRVTLAEAATIAGMIAAPNPFHPVRHPEEATTRRNLVLDRMAEVGFVPADEAKKARDSALVTHAAAGGRSAPWAVDLAIELAEGGDKGAEGSSGAAGAAGVGRVAREALTVQTQIQPQLQRLAEQALREGLAEVVASHPKVEGVQAALVVLRARDGAVVAMVGGKDYGDSAFNRVVNSPRQVGSTVKALTLVSALEADAALSPATIFEDAAIERVVDGKTWAPANYDQTFLGPISLRQSIAKSRNIPAVLLAERVGLSTLKGRLQALGLSRATAYPSVSLGGFSATPAELAGAYTVFAADGAWHGPSLVRAILPREGSEPLVDHPPAKATTRFSPRAAFVARDVMRSVLSEGTGKSAAKYGVGSGAAGKSGTTDDYADAWFAGVSGPYSVVAWVGYDRPKSMGLTGGQAALPIWARFVDATGTDDAVPAAPDGVVALEVCEATGKPPCADCTESRSEWFTAGTEPVAECGLAAVPEEVAEAVKEGWERLGELFGLNR